MYNLHRHPLAASILATAIIASLVVLPIRAVAQDVPGTPAVPAENEAQLKLYLPLIEQTEAPDSEPTDEGPGDQFLGEFTSQPVTNSAELELSPSAAAHTPAEFEAVLADLAASEVAQQTPLGAAVFDSIVEMPAEVRAAVSQSVLHTARAQQAGSPWVVSTYRSDGNWSEAVAVPRYIIDAGWEIAFSDEDLVEVLAWRGPSGRYYTYAEGSAGFALLAAAVPGWFADYSANDAVDSTTAAAEAYLFPWTKGQRWYKNGGWHAGSGWAAGDAIDFQAQPASGNYPTNYAVLAPISGTFKRICGPDPVGQSAVSIVNSSAGTTKILHIDNGSIPSKLLSQQVVRGQYLGHAHVPNKPTDQGCGLGAARHIHVVFPSKTIAVDGYVANDLANAAFGSLYTSTNQRVNNHLAALTVTNVWTNDNGSDWNTGKTSFRPGEPIRYIAAVTNNTGSALSAQFVFEATGPSGRIAYYSGVNSTGAGTVRWGLSSTIPADAASGVYTFRATVTYNGISSARSWTFNVQGIDCSGRYKAEYYINRDLSGSPRYVACEGWPISHDWGNGGPGNGIGNDDFSARWTGAASFAAGRYRFTAEADDGVRVWIDGVQIINEWRDQGTTTFRHERDVTAGTHQVRVEYYEHGGGAVARFRWDQITSSSGNLALGRPSYASSQESSSYVPAKANDGNTSTRWSSMISTSLGQQWWYADLGGRTYDRVRITWENSYAAYHFIGWSNDCVSYTGNYYTISGAGTYTYNIGSHSEKCVAVFMLTRAPRMNNYSFWEVEVANGGFAAAAEGTAADVESPVEEDADHTATPTGTGIHTLPPEAYNAIYLPVINN